MKVFNNSVDLNSVIEETKLHGYCFVNNSLNEEVKELLEKEANGLLFEYGDHTNYPINKNTNQIVFQSHERSYHYLDDPTVPVANNICYSLSKELTETIPEFPKEWLLTEIGYQNYRDSRDYISPHRDRKSDKILSITFTIVGSNWIDIHESTVDPPDYKKLKLIKKVKTEPGTTMFLRAPGFGSGIQTIHEVHPPLDNKNRVILNLRMRERVLKPPKWYTEQYK